MKDGLFSSEAQSRMKAQNTKHSQKYIRDDDWELSPELWLDYKSDLWDKVIRELTGDQGDECDLLSEKARWWNK